MAANKKIRLGPAALNGVPTYTTNIWNCAVTSMAGPVGMTVAQPYMVLNKIKVVNASGAARTFRLYIGATGANAAGTEVAFDVSVAAGSYVEIFGNFRMDSGDFMVGAASGTLCSVSAEGEIGISG
jgi:hypothetical protein